MINQDEWLRTRKNLLDEVKAQVEVRLGPLPPTLKRYAKNLDKEFRRAWSPCNERELRGRLNRAQIILGADFHAYAQSQRAHVRILRDLITRPRVILALECLPPDKEPAADDFIKGKISESRFLELVEWDKNWGFPWEHYRPLFQLARDRGYSVRGLNQSPKSRLDSRDAWCAKRIKELLKEDPQALVYVVIGEWHLASGHLPKRLRQNFPQKDQIAILFQDAERLYFKLAAQKKEAKVDYLKSNGNRFCVMVSPPWMKWQSYLMYLEQAYDRDLQEDFAIDYSDHVASLIELISSDLKIQVAKSRVQVYCPDSETSLAKLKLSLPKKNSHGLKYHLEHALSFYLPEKEWMYLSRATINHASGLAGQFIHAHLSRRKRTLWNLPEDFLPLIWVEALGFFFSKWINPKRKADTLESIRLRLAAGARDDGRKALLLALDHRLSEVVWVQTGRMRRPRYSPRELPAYFEASRIVGSMLGERLFQKVRSRTILPKELMSYLKVNVENERFADFYWRLIRDLEHDQAL
jgi:hypothetical protein